MTRWQRGSAVAGLFIVGGAALVAGMTIAVLHALEILRGVTLWAWWAFQSGFRLPGAASDPTPIPLPVFDFLSPGLGLVGGVLVLLLAWVTIIAATTLAWPGRRDRTRKPRGLDEDARRLLTGE
ncbi:hypothetical protein [Microbacterium sp.]|jgi:hypothetical protein|uniref:hypothetical protein n=1 Tax=Microbacterium sp. TaxID=51671 RepID=UPI0037C549F9